jgi:hypothetical protein
MATSLSNAQSASKVGKELALKLCQFHVLTSSKTMKKIANKIARLVLVAIFFGIICLGREPMNIINNQLSLTELSRVSIGIQHNYL